MPLQIRRGTAAEKDLLNVPLANGELLWTTDSKQLYIGDGTNLARDLTAVVNYSDEDAQDAVNALLSSGTHTDITYTYDDVANTLSSSVSVSQLRQNVNMAGFDLTGTGNISINGNVSAEQFAGALQGSVFGDDSVQLVNADESQINLDGTVKGDVIPDLTETHDLGSPTKRFKDLYLSGSSLWLGMAQVTASGTSVDLPAGSTINGEPLGEIAQPGNSLQVNIIGEDSSIIVDSETSTVRGNFVGSVFSNDSSTVIDGTTGEIFGNLTGDVNGNLTGNVTGTVTGSLNGDVSGSVFGDDSTLLVDGVDNKLNAPLHADIFNQSGDKVFDFPTGEYRGNVNGLIYSRDDVLLLDTVNSRLNILEILPRDPSSARVTITRPDNGDILDLRIESKQTKSRININTVDLTGDLSSYSDFYGTLNFGYQDATTERSDVTIRGSRADMRMAHDTVTTFISDESKYFTLKEGNFGFGTYTPTEKMDVRGNAVFTGDVEAAAFKGSLVGDDSTILIDAINGSIQIASVDLIGETGNTPSTPGSVDSWLEVSVNGATKYIPLYA